jgi:hypothetical protein
VTHSLNEIEALARRATRGAGVSWGMAEEAAKATRWLASHGLPGVATLADVLTQNDGVAHETIAPASLSAVWAAPSGRLCPLAAGAALNDCADQLLPGEIMEMVHVSHPLLVVPFAAWASIHIATPVTVSWMNVRIETDGYRILIDDQNSQIDVAKTACLSCERSERLNSRATEPGFRGTVTKFDGTRLGAFAHRTYAPATKASRDLGAGAGVSDND